MLLVSGRHPLPIRRRIERIDRLTTTNDTNANATLAASGAKATVEKDLPFVMSCAVLAITGAFRQIKNVYVRRSSAMRGGSTM